MDGTQLSDAVFDENSNDSVGFKDNLISFLAKLRYGRYMLRDNYWLLPDNYSEEEQKLADALQLRTEYSDEKFQEQIDEFGKLRHDIV